MGPICLHAQNEGPVINKPLPDQILDQDGPSLDIDLKNYLSDPDVASPAVQLEMMYSGKTEVIYLALFWQHTPKTAQNFVDYIQANRYSENLIHRSAPGFVIQGGGYRFAPDFIIEDVPEFSAVENEPGISNTRGTVAMAKLGGDPNSATSQWFINLKNNASTLDDLNGGFTAFARVLGDGMSVADEVANIPVYDTSFQLGGAFGELPLTEANLQRSSFVETTASLIEPLQFTASSSDANLVTVSLDPIGGLTLTPSANDSGEATITIEATDLDGVILETGFKVTVLPNVQSYQDWSASYSFATPEDAAPSEDPDRDGWNNLLEYVFVTDPLNPTHPPIRFQALDTGNFRFTIRKNVGTGVRVESSTDMTSWTSIWNSSQGPSGPAVIAYQTTDDLATFTLRPNPFGLNLIPRYWRIVVVDI
ncbi:MAG: peptidylprolyl isomerase [Verrucomicrobiae bacterium]|nr:peptidylprolyl isomerase [Verrucomicrobiae bacterium]